MIISPASACGVVGLKPAVGLISRTGSVPISAAQDTAGPLTSCVSGLVSGLPVGLSFIGPAWNGPRLLGLGHAFEQARPAQGKPRAAIA